MTVDRILGLGAVLLAAVVGVVSWRFGVGRPVSRSGVLAAADRAEHGGLGAALLGAPARPPRRARRGGSRWGALWVALGTLAFYVLALEPLGYLAATFVLLVVQLRWVEGRSWRGSFLTSALAAAISLIVFRASLNVPLPQGMLPLPRW